ncbi:FAST kinase domain-containing protein 5, mitochondrial isoform X2 [Agrilus planipennis]|uniref:FAST kinase domain-containing protein 5, mitochondrial isoform X2 n=1 Tax=Agrilus planipennis TaxID=224129 RepID=A0A1W4X8M0_AGRPL|nr:FAST kinase domain-containing protein 5, mitochondrial isoform X2 [Agrilus planipennis]
MYRLMPTQFVVDYFRSVLLKTFNKAQLKLTNYSVYNKPKYTSVIIFSEQRRTFSVSTFLTSKLFTEHENDFAFQVMKKISLPRLENFQLKSPNEAISSLEKFNGHLNQEWRSKTASEIIQCFIDCLDYCVNNNITVADPRFDKLVDGLVDHVEHINDEELSQLLQCLTKYPSTDSHKSHNFHDIWSALDDLCCWKLPTWTLEKMFHFAELWYNLRLARPSDFVFEMIDKLIRKVDKLTKEELIIAFFYLKVNKRRQLPFELRDALDRYCEQMTIDEMALCATTFNFCKTSTKSSVFCSELIQRLKQEAKTVNDATVKSICQLLRLSSTPTLSEKFTDLLDVLTEEVDRLSNLSCLHIALLGTNLQLLHEKSVSKVSRKLVKDFGDVDKIRLKDIERLLLVLTTFELHPKTEPDVFKAAYDEIHQERRLTEIIRHPKCLPCILHYLSIKGIYSYELMNRILDPDFIIETFGKSPKSIPRELFCLDPSIEIECPDYKGHRLSKEVRRKVTKWNTEYTPSVGQTKKPTAADLLAIDVTETVSKIVIHKSHYFINHILPHFSRSDIIICKNIRREEFIKIEGFENYTLGDIMYPPKRDDCRWYAICVIGRNSTIRDTTKVLGLMNMKRRQLEKIGYIPVIVLWNEYRHLSDQEKLDYILNKIC